MADDIADDGLLNAAKPFGSIVIDQTFYQYQLGQSIVDASNRQTTLLIWISTTFLKYPAFRLIQAQRQSLISLSMTVSLCMVHLWFFLNMLSKMVAMNRCCSKSLTGVWKTDATMNTTPLNVCTSYSAQKSTSIAQHHGIVMNGSRLPCMKSMREGVVSYLSSNNFHNYLSP